ncbi:uncharacterized protein LACBIDRAFT_310683 [Laccaria bicolor S238N-H82]|uniref:Predicted protein n=1 Tax=Laccaria bicolor (strain S238N-H82 / ATCC MYA-4686) TaxID=486041 RepID=B0DUW5_LACBS|nr:uncharacterized protein LACBIDRAFT_310683 [Laccaria bicolor S238N-H82]EDR01616.1 predicted protein [Laccaria bicolor S238N-H82]|eukprot:XP_001887692.1 predicted protein [Laccaria bicolor S238N-H82]
MKAIVINAIRNRRERIAQKKWLLPASHSPAPNRAPRPSMNRSAQIVCRSSSVRHIKWALAERSQRSLKSCTDSALFKPRELARRSRGIRVGLVGQPLYSFPSFDEHNNSHKWRD